MVELEGAHRLSPAEQEVLRLRVVSVRSVGTWWHAYRQDGRDGLATRRGRPGPTELISPEDRGTLFAAMADHTPEELLIGGPL